MVRWHRTLTLGTMGLVSVLWGCFTRDAAKDTPFVRRDGTWYYGDAPIIDADARSFRVLSKQYAADARRVYFGSTYRKGQEYYSIKHHQVRVIANADPTTFSIIRGDYARDQTHIFHLDRVLPVRDPASFALTPWGLYTHDRLVAYYDDVEIVGSDGATFAPRSDHYAVDRAHVYYHERVIADDPATFEVLESGAARTATTYFVNGDVTAPPKP